MSEYIEMIGENGQQSENYLQSVLSIAQSRLNDMMVKSINDEAKLRQKINSLQLENENLRKVVERLTPGKFSPEPIKRAEESNGGQSQITMQASQ